MMEDRGLQVAGPTIALLTLSIVAVGVRCYVRCFLIRSFGYDDWLIVATLGLYMIYCIFVLLGVRYGTGRHIVDLAPQDFSNAMKMWFVCEVFYGFSSTFCKLAGGSLLLRLTTKKTHVRLIWSVMILASIFGIVFAAQILAQCQPTGFFWSPTRDPTQGHCVNPKIILGFTYAHAVVSALGDWTFGILPAFIVKGLNMNLRSKISVFLVLAVANIGSIATLIRIPAIRQISTSQDFLFATVDLAIWSSVEIGLAIIAASIATYKPLFRSFFSSGNTGNMSNRSYVAATDAGRFHDSAPFRHAPPQVLTLQEIKGEHKAALSEESSSEIYRISDPARSA